MNPKRRLMNSPRGRLSCSAVPFAVAAHADHARPGHSNVKTRILKLVLVADINKIIVAAVNSFGSRAVAGLDKVISVSEPAHDIVGRALKGPSGNVNDDKYAWLHTVRERKMGLCLM